MIVAFIIKALYRSKIRYLYTIKSINLYNI